MELKVYMHSGEEYVVEVESYNAAELNEQRNDDTISSILIGDYSLSRINIRDVVPIYNETEQPTKEPVEEPNEQNNDVEK